MAAVVVVGAEDGGLEALVVVGADTSGLAEVVGDVLIRRAVGPEHAVRMSPTVAKAVIHTMAVDLN